MFNYTALFIHFIQAKNVEKKKTQEEKVKTDEPVPVEEVPVEVAPVEVAPVEVAPVEEAPVLNEFDAAAGDSTSAEQDAAAIKIQASIRGKKERKEQKELQDGAAKIQARFRGKNIFNFFFQIQVLNCN